VVAIAKNLVARRNTANAIKQDFLVEICANALDAQMMIILKLNNYCRNSRISLNLK